MRSFNREVNLAPNGHLNSKGHVIAKTALTKLGVRGTLKKAVSLPDGKNLPAGMQIIIQPLTQNSHEFLITPYQPSKDNESDDLPESRRDIVAGESHRVVIEHPEDVLLFNNEHFRKSNEALFPTLDSPTVEEIAQCRIPDCFLLAAIQAILTHQDGKSFIRGMMHDNGDGTTTVRLYNPETLQPEYVRVENSIIVDRFGELNVHKALWVHVLEKAYAVRGKSTKGDVDASMSSVYSGGGYEHVAIKTLTGLELSQNKTKSVAMPWQIEKFLGSENFNMIKSLLVEAGLTVEQLSHFIQSTLKKSELDEIFRLLNAKIGDATSENRALTQYVHLIKFYIEDKALYEEAWDKRSVKNLDPMKHPVGVLLRHIFKRIAPFAGFYTGAHMSVYDGIRAGLKEGKLITASTPKKISETAVGLAGNHAYTVLGVEERQLDIKDAAGNTKKITAYFVKIRNPWGVKDGVVGQLQSVFSNKTGLVYEQNIEELDVRETNTNDPVSMVELSQFCRYFEGCVLSSSANEKFQHDAEKEKCISDIADFVEQTKVDFTSSHAAILNANQQHDAFVRELMKVELLELGTLETKLLGSINVIFASNLDIEKEETEVFALIDSGMFPTVPGSNLDVKSHVYALLKYRWLQSQKIQDSVEEKRLIDIVQRNAAQPVLWGALFDLKIVLNTVMMTRANSYQFSDESGAEYQYKADLNYMAELAEKIKEQIRELTKLTDPAKEIDFLDIEMQINALMGDFINLESRYHQFINLEQLVKNFGYQFVSGYQDDIEKVKQVIDSYDMIAQLMSNEVKPQFKQLQALRAEIRIAANSLEEKHVITPAENQQIEKVTRFMFSGKLKAVGEQFLESGIEEKKDLGKKLVEADTIAAKLKRLLSGITSFFTKLSAHVSGFFHHPNQYELPAIDTGKKPRISVSG